MGDEGPRFALARLPREQPVLVGRDRLFLHQGRVPGGEGAQPDTVGFTVALPRQTVGRLQQPEGGAHPIRRGGQSEQPTHSRLLSQEAKLLNNTTAQPR